MLCFRLKRAFSTEHIIVDHKLFIKDVNVCWKKVFHIMVTKVL